MSQARPILTGPAFATIEAVLRELPAYAAFRAGRLGHARFHALVDAQAEKLVTRGLPPSDVPFVKRLPACGRSLAAAALAELARRGLVPAAAFDESGADRIEALLARYQHGPFRTFIYPEEGLLLWALAEACRPAHALFLGSYYGYWAHWAVPAIAAAGGRVTLVDPDERCCAVARLNVEAAGFAGSVSVVTATGEAFLAGTDELFDWVVLDAENPRDHPVAEQRGKRVYHSLLKASLPRLSPDAFLVCHNILFTDGTGDAAFRDIVARNLDELGPFAALTEEHFDFVEIGTTEGVGVGRRRAVPEPA